MSSVHKTVLLQETIDGLDLKDGATVVDCTFGGGGHSYEVCTRFPKAKIVALDQDASAFEKAKEKFAHSTCDIHFVNENFGILADILTREKIENVDGIIFDLGLSSDQLEDAGRGFSFMKDEPLHMTMKENPRPEDLTAREIVNTWSEENLAAIIHGYGEERYARAIARAITKSREEKEIATTFDLVTVIEGAVPKAYRRGRIHPATRTFQALRIAVNDELGNLRKGLLSGFESLRGGGRMAVISFHSLEDRIVKRFFVEKVKEGKAIFPPRADEPRAQINKKPIVPGAEEIRENPRSRSAKLRILEKTPPKADQPRAEK